MPWSSFEFGFHSRMYSLDAASADVPGSRNLRRQVALGQATLARHAPMRPVQAIGEAFPWLTVSSGLQKTGLGWKPSKPVG
jgi:hypothetical protein